MVHGLLPLLRTRRFLPLFVTQFLGAMNDNLLKNALAILIVYEIGAGAGAEPGVLVAIAAGLFIAPYFLFSATAGQIADRYEKSLLLRVIKFAEIPIMALAAVGLALAANAGTFLAHERGGPRPGNADYVAWLTSLATPTTTISSSYAGALPFVVDAVHIDALGLNTPYIARHGTFDPDGPQDSKTDMRWVIEQRTSRWRNSIGFSIVTTCRGCSRLMASTIAATVELLPAPPGPVTITSPRSPEAISASASGAPSEDSVGTAKGITRSTIMNEERWRRMFTRNRPTPGAPHEQS